MTLSFSFKELFNHQHFVNVKHSFWDTNCFFQETWSMMYDDVFISRICAWNKAISNNDLTTQTHVCNNHGFQY